MMKKKKCITTIKKVGLNTVGLDALHCAMALLPT